MRKSLLKTWLQNDAMSFTNLRSSNLLSSNLSSYTHRHIYIIGLGFISVCIGLYTLVVLCQMVQGISNPSLKLNSKYNIIQMYFVLTRCHVLIFDTLGNNNYLACYPPISAFTLAICKLTSWFDLFGFLSRLSLSLSPPISLSPTSTDRHPKFSDGHSKSDPVADRSLPVPQGSTREPAERTVPDQQRIAEQSD